MPSDFRLIHNSAERQFAHHRDHQIAGIDATREVLPERLALSAEGQTDTTLRQGLGDGVLEGRPPSALY